MKIWGVIVNLILITSIVSCVGIGIPNSSDPYKKLKYSYIASSEERPIPAKKLIVQAIEIFKERNDKKGLAEAYLRYGQYHKWAFENGPHFKNSNYIEAAKYFNKALSLFNELGDKNGVARSHFGLGQSLSDRKAGCKHYDLAITSYDEEGEQFPINPNFKDFPSMVRAFKKKFCN